MTALALGAATSGSTVVSGTTGVTGTFTPTAAGNLVLIEVYHVATTPTAPLSIVGASITSVKRISGQLADSTHQLDVYAAITTASASTITFTWNETTSGSLWYVREVLHADVNRGFWSAFHSGVQGIAAIAVGGSGTGTTATTTFTRCSDTNNGLFTFYGLNNASGTTPEAGWTDAVDNNTVGAPFVGVNGQWKLGGADLVNTSTFTSAAWASIGVEVWGEDASGNWVANETFTKTDGTGWTGDQPWTNAGGVGNLRTISNQAVSDNATAIIGRMDLDSSTSAHEAAVQATTMELGTISFVGLRLRSDATTTDGYEFLRVGAATLGGFTVTLRKWVSTNVTSLGNLVIPRAAVGTPEVLYMTAIGNTLTCYLNGVQVLAATDSSLPTKLRGGLTIRGSATGLTTADNFAFGDIGKARPQVTLTGTVPTSSSAKASLRSAKKLTGKASTTDNGRGVRLTQTVRIRGTFPEVSAIRVTTIATLAEGFNVYRRLIAKVRQSSSAKATLDSGSKALNAKVPFSSAGGGVFFPASLTVDQGIQEAVWPIASEVTATVERNVGFEAKVFQSAGGTAYLLGRTRLFANVPTVQHVVEPYMIGRTPFIAFAPTTINTTGIELVLVTPQFFFRCPIEYYAPFLPQVHDKSYRLFRHYRPRPSGRNVYFISNGNVTESDPDGFNVVWKPEQRTGDAINAAWVIRVFWGGHDREPVTPAEAAKLVLAGYELET